MDVSKQSSNDASVIEDEDVYSESNQVHRYMQTTDFRGAYEVYGVRHQLVDLELTMRPKKQNLLLSYLLNTTDLKMLDDQVSKILVCGLVIEEHLHFLVNLYEGHKRAQLVLKEKICPSKLLIFSSGVFSFAWSSALCYLKKGGALQHLLPMMVPITTWALWKSHQDTKRLSDSQCTVKFINVLDKLFLTVRKSVRLIEENQTFAEAYLIAKSGISDVLHRSPDYAANLHLMPSLRGIVFECTKDVVNVLFQTGQTMTDAIPLFYLPMNDSDIKLDFEETLSLDRFSLITIKRLRNVYILSQSEVLLRLALTLCPAFWTYSIPSNLEKIFSAISLATEKLRTLETYMNTEYQIVCSFVTSPAESTLVASTVKTPSVKLVDVYSGVVTAVMRLQAMTLATRAIKDSIETYTFVGDNEEELFLVAVQDDLSKLSDEVDSLFSAFHVALGEVKKLTKRYGTWKPVVIPQQHDESSGCPVVDQEDYVVEDEVFELYCQKNEGHDYERERDNYFSMEDAAEKEKSQQSAVMVKELKNVLKGKAEEWRVREEVALRKRGDFEETVPHSYEVSSRLELEARLNSGLGLATSTYDEIDVSDFRRREEMGTVSAWEISRALKSNALRSVFPVQNAGDEFCCSGDESEGEEKTVESC